MSSNDPSTTDLTLIWRLLRRELIIENTPFPPGVILRKEYAPSPALMERWKVTEGAEPHQQLSKLQDRFFDYAFENGIDPTEPGWELDIVAKVLREHPFFKPMLGLPRGRGRPKVEPWEQNFRLLGFVTSASRLKAIMQLHRRDSVTDRDLARQMVQREHNPEHLADKNWVWPNDSLFADSVFNLERSISRYRDQLRKLKERGVRTPKNARILNGRQKDHRKLNWEPSETELERYPEWKTEQRRIWQEWFPPER